MTAAELKPCPFCGGTDLDFDYTESQSECWVICNDCGSHGPFTTIGCRDEDDEEDGGDGPIDLEAEACELWNSRGSLPS